MQTDLSEQLRNRLNHLRDSIQRDRDALQPRQADFPDAKPIFDELFDAIESTLQNVDVLSADESGN